MYQEEYKRWLEADLEDADLSPELARIEGNDEEIKDRFAVALKFGTAGLRGVLGAGTNRMNIYVVRQATQGLANWVKTQGGTQTVAISYDSRLKSDVFAKTAAGVLAANGINVRIYDALMPVPALSFATRYYNCNAGVMVTASHNPSKYNGYKVYGADGCQITTEAAAAVLAEIEKLDIFADVKKMDFDEAVKEGLIEEIYPLNEYLDNIIANIDMDAIRNAGLRVALDPMYGVSEIPLKTLLLTSRCDVETIHDNHDTLFGGKLPSPTATTLRGLITRVMDYNFDIGIATDGDADRIGVIDDTGRYLHPNDILVLLYYYLVKYKGWHGAVVRNVATTHMLDKVAKKFGEQCYEVPVGFKYISAKMTEVDAVIGGESSGGLTVRGHINGKDGIYAAMLLIEMIAVTGRKISEIYKDIEAECGSIYMEERDYKFSVEKKAEIKRILMEEQRIPDLPYKIEKVSYMDGCKIYFKNGGWVIGRFSGTEPLIRIFCEMPEKEDAIKVCDILKEFLGL